MVRTVCLALALLTAVTTASGAGQTGKESTDALAGNWFKMSRFELRHAALSEALVSANLSYAAPQISFEDHYAATGRKSRGRAFLQSLLLPGWGQHYAGSKTMMRVFVTSEVLLWGGFIGFTKWSDLLEDDYRTFASTHAQVDVAGKASQFFVDIGNFISLEEFNQAQLRDRDVSDLYPTDSGDFFWQWDSDANRRDFEDMRIRSDKAANNAEFMVAAIFVNHFISAIHATLSVFKHNKRVRKMGLNYHLHLAGTSDNRTLKLSLTKKL